MDELDQILQATPKACFSIINDETKDYGFVDPRFYKKFRRELSEVWRLIDFNKMHNVLLFEVNRYGPKVTIGWEELRRTYNLRPNDSFFMRYLGIHDGNSTFHLTVIKTEQKEDIPEPSQPVEPLIHPQPPSSPPSSLRQPFNWEIVLTAYQAKASQLNLPKDVADIVKTWNITSVTLFISPDMETRCKLLIRSSPRSSLKFGEGWKQFCLINSITKNTRLRFHFDYEMKPQIKISII